MKIWVTTFPYRRALAPHQSDGSTARPSERPRQSDGDTARHGRANAPRQSDRDTAPRRTLLPDQIRDGMARRNASAASSGGAAAATKPSGRTR
ncbi:hypothetical protein GCM10010166_55380 [Couchioplanes caeruleus subsp. azureus]|nr:hypothetical protein GCM10010166_55380 [Couchioplanes caeruleus subsp. azureus]